MQIYKSFRIFTAQWFKWKYNFVQAGIAKAFLFQILNAIWSIQYKYLSQCNLKSTSTHQKKLAFLKITPQIFFPSQFSIKYRGKSVLKSTIFHSSQRFLKKQEQVCSLKDRLVVDLLLIKCWKFWFGMTLDESNYQIGCLAVFWLYFGIWAKWKKIRTLTWTYVHKYLSDS